MIFNWVKRICWDTAKVLGRMFDGIEFRGFPKTVEQLAEFSGYRYGMG